MTVCVICIVTLAAHAQELPEERTKFVEGPMQKLTPILGTWEIDDQWESGSPLWARNEYKVGVGGRFLEAKTYSKNPAGKIYQRYFTVFGYNDDENEYMSWGFTYDGTEKTVPLQITEVDGKVEMTSEWAQGPSSRIKQTVTIKPESDHYVWKVWSQDEGSDWAEIMNGKWKRVEPQS